VPIFECSRCNHLTYSATTRIELRCGRCGAERLRVLDDPVSFEEARVRPRLVSHGDHASIAFDAPDEVTPILVSLLRTGVGEGAVVHAFLPPDLAGPARERLGEDAAHVVFADSAEIYGDFDPEAVIGHYRAMVADEDRPIYVAASIDRPVSEVAPLEVWTAYEERVHELTVELGMVVLCLYDRALHDAPYLDVCSRTHPLSGTGGALHRNDAFAYEPAG
jgi:hypothetical protein